MKMEIGMPLEMRDAFAVVDRRAADCAVDIIAFFEQEFGEERTVLACDTCNERFFHYLISDFIAKLVKIIRFLKFSMVGLSCHFRSLVAPISRQHSDKQGPDNYIEYKYNIYVDRARQQVVEQRECH